MRCRYPFARSSSVTDVNSTRQLTVSISMHKPTAVLDDLSLPPCYRGHGRLSLSGGYTCCQALLSNLEIDPITAIVAIVISPHSPTSSPCRPLSHATQGSFLKQTAQGSTPGETCNKARRCVASTTGQTQSKTETTPPCIEISCRRDCRRTGCRIFSETAVGFHQTIPRVPRKVQTHSRQTATASSTPPIRCHI